MTAIALLVIFAGYSVGSYGYVLIRGFNITPRQWFDPLNTTPPDWTPNNVPSGQVFPGSGTSTSAQTTSAPGTPGTPGSPGTPSSSATPATGVSQNNLNNLGAGGSGGIGTGIANAALHPAFLQGVTANPNVGALFPVILPNANGVSENNLQRLGG